MFTVMFTMSATEIKRVLKANRKRRVRPWALKHIAEDMRPPRPRSMLTMAVKTPARYPAMRQHIESVLVASAQQKNGRRSGDALTPA